MFKLILKFSIAVLLAASFGNVSPGLQAAEFDWSEIERVFESPLADKLVDDTRSRRIEIDPPKKSKRKPKKKTMRFSLDYAVSKVRRQYNGKVIGARTSWRGDEAIHRIKLRTNDGRVRTISISGTTGR